MLDGKTVLITGGTGSFGKKFIKVVLEKYSPKKIIVYSRDELKQYELQLIYPTSNYPIRYFIGDVRDLPRLKMAMNDVDIVVHAAALKQIPTIEYNPFEAVKTNVIGGQNVIDAALAANVSRVIALSTDKACAPLNLYGATKLTSDKLFIAANNYKGKHDIRFSVVRYGNVMGSRGSVIPLMLSLRDAGVLTITDKRMTRFNITLQEGVDFVLNCLSTMNGRELFVPKLPSYHITDITTAICPDCKIETMGIRPGEKIHEEMISIHDAMNTVDYGPYYVIYPEVAKMLDKAGNILNIGDLKGSLCDPGFSYNSGDNEDFLSVKQIRNLIEQEPDDLAVVGRI